MSAVKKFPFRIIAAFMLVVALLTLSGVTSTAGTLLEAATANSCCNSGCDDSPGNAGPCSTPDCPCFSCISMVMASTVTVLRSSPGELLSHVSAQHFHLSEFIPPIDYPPEAA